MSTETATQTTVSFPNTLLDYLQLSHTFGRLGEGDGLLCRPWGVACTPEGQLVVTDRTNNRVQVFSKNGWFLFKFGEQGHFPGQFFRPAGVTVSSEYQIIIADKDNHRIQIFNRNGNFINMFGEQGCYDGQFSYPWDVAVSPKGFIAVSDSENNRVQIFDKHLKFYCRVILDGIPRGLAFREDSSLLVTDFENHKIVMFDEMMFDLGSTERKMFNRPQGIAVHNGLGCIALSDGKNNQVVVCDSKLNQLKVFNCEGPEGPSTPQGLCFHRDGSLIVVNLENFIQVFSFQFPPP